MSRRTEVAPSEVAAAGLVEEEQGDDREAERRGVDQERRARAEECTTKPPTAGPTNANAAWRTNCESEFAWTRRCLGTRSG